MPNHVCEPCGSTFETLTKKRLHQKDDCPGLFDNIDTDGKDPDEIAGRTARGLLTCQDCEQVHDGPFTRGDDHTTAGYSIEIRFRCQRCGFQNVNTAVMEGTQHV